MKKELKSLEESFQVFGVSGKPENMMIKEHFIQKFVCNYLSYCKDKELKEIEKTINEIGLLEVSLNRVIKPDYYVYDPNYLIPLLQETDLLSNDFLKPLFLSEELRKLIVLPENRFSEVSRKYTSFIEFMNLLVARLVETFGEEVELKTLENKMIQNIIRKHISDHLKTDRNKYLLMLIEKNFYKDKEILMMKFDFVKFELIYYTIDFNCKCPIFYSDLDKLNAQTIDERYIKEINEMMDNHYKVDLAIYTPEENLDFYNNFLNLVKRITKKFEKDESKSIKCSICRERYFHRTKKNNWNTNYCLECNELINLILDAKNEDNKKIKRSSVIRSLTKDIEKVYSYCNNLLNNLKINNSKLEKLKKKIETVFFVVIDKK